MPLITLANSFNFSSSFTVASPFRFLPHSFPFSHSSISDHHYYQLTVQIVQIWNRPNANRHSSRRWYDAVFWSFSLAESNGVNGFGWRCRFVTEYVIFVLSSCYWFLKLISMWYDYCRFDEMWQISWLLNMGVWLKPKLFSGLLCFAWFILSTHFFQRVCNPNSVYLFS